MTTTINPRFDAPARMPCPHCGRTLWRDDGDPRWRPGQGPPHYEYWCRDCESEVSVTGPEPDLAGLAWVSTEALPGDATTDAAAIVLATLHKRVPLDSDGIVWWDVLDWHARPWSETERLRVLLARSLSAGDLAHAAARLDDRNWAALLDALELARRP